MELGPRDGVLLLRTGVTGSAARLGHSLLISVDDWSAELGLAGDEVTSVTLEAWLPSLRVVSGTGGVKSMSEADRATIRSNALASLGAEAHPYVTFTSEEVSRSADALVVTGRLTVAGASRSLSAEVRLEPAAGRVRATCEVLVRQTDFGVTPYSAMLGQLRVADEVRVELDVTAPRV